MPSALGTRERERPVFETLEPRILLSADLTYGMSPGDPTDLLLRLNAGNYELFDQATNTVVSSELADSNTINITGTTGADFLELDLGTLGSGKTINFSGDGDDTLRSTKNSDQTLTNTSLNAGGQTFTLSGFQKAELTGGNSANTLDASAFTGDVTLSGLGGVDRLIGGTGNDTLIGGLGMTPISLSTAGVRIPSRRSRTRAPTVSTSPPPPRLLKSMNCTKKHGAEK
ncbi:LEPR-XLL domain-containing protein [Nitrospina watsonii]|nr:LEPR-XLL domain-containing protein [Nitrospina watsonii]